MWSLNIQVVPHGDRDYVSARVYAVNGSRFGSVLVERIVLPTPHAPQDVEELLSDVVAILGAVVAS